MNFKQKTLESVKGYIYNT